MKLNIIPYQVIALSAPSTAGVPTYQQFIAPYAWKPRDQNTFLVKNYQAAIIKLNYNTGEYALPSGTSFNMQFKFIVEGSSDGMVYMTISEWLLDVPNTGSNYERILEIPLMGITHLRPVLQSVDFRGRVAVMAQMYLK